MRIHILADNRVMKRGFLAEHGLSLLIVHGGKLILFDTGQTGVYAANARRMSLDLSRVDHVALSHGHFDHCGGLPFFPGPLPPVYVRSSAFAPRYSGDPAGGLWEVGIPWTAGQRDMIAPRIVYCEPHTLLGEGIHLVGALSDGAAPAAGFYTGGPGQYAPDRFDDEQALVIEDERGLSVFLGCSHPGVERCLRRVREVFPGRPIGALVAGMHLSRADAERIGRTIDVLWEMDIGRLVPLHCTGLDAIVRMAGRWGGRCTSACAGETVEL